ncbi:MAG: hypothetical protein B7Z37_20730 [Verrucomicrobia bacterium 12-59-8]|nr:MAG: hypothetical protein B7Z37_20730 [Verrucomicrobia bacterium 12-59-8]
MRGLAGGGACFGVQKKHVSIMKTKIIRPVLLLIAGLNLSCCASAGLGFRNSFRGSVTPGERIAAGAFDVVTLPVQVPVIVAMKLSE